MQVTISNAGKAAIHFSRAKSIFETRFNELANCKTCDEETKRSFQEGSLFFAELLEQIMNQRSQTLE